MKLIFLHGLGQGADSWSQVMAELTDYDCQALELFHEGKLPASFDQLRRDILAELAKLDEDFVLVGLSLGGMLAISLMSAELPHLKGMVLSGAQYRLRGNLAAKVQKFIFRLLPKSFFRKQGLDKDNLLTFYSSMADLDFTDSLQHFTDPCLVLCGEKDRVNLKVAKELAQLLPKASFKEIAKGQHALNTQLPEVFAGEVRDFVEETVLD